MTPPNMSTTPNRKRSVIREWLPLALLLLGMLGIYVGFEVVGSRRVTPPASVQDFDGFMKWNASPREIQIVGPAGADHLLILGDNAGLLPSGPSAYVFDKHGKLVTWTPDIGDSPASMQAWLPSPGIAGRTVTVAEARQWIRPASTQP